MPRYALRLHWVRDGSAMGLPWVRSGVVCFGRPVCAINLPPMCHGNATRPPGVCNSHWCGYAMCMRWDADDMPWACHGYAMGMPCACHGCTIGVLRVRLGMPCSCSGRPWICHGSSLDMPSACHGCAMGAIAMCIPWVCHGFPAECYQWACHMHAMATVRPCHKICNMCANIPWKSLRWIPDGYAMRMLRLCYGHAADMPWICGACAIGCTMEMHPCSENVLVRSGCAIDMPRMCRGICYRHANGYAMVCKLSGMDLSKASRGYATYMPRISDGCAAWACPSTADVQPMCRRCATDVLCECHGHAIDLPLICYGGGRICYGYARDVLRHAIDIMAACYACATDALRVCYGCATSYGIPTDVVCICYRTSIAEVAPT